MQSFNRIWTISTLSLLELYRRKDIYVALILGLIIIAPLASINIFGVEGVFAHVKEITLLLIWLFSVVIAVTTSSRQLPLEMSKKTIFPLIAKPISRNEFVLGKLLGSFLASSTAILLFYVFLTIVSLIKGVNPFSLAFCEAIILHLCFIALVVAMTTCGSMILTQSANNAISMLVIFFMLMRGKSILADAEKMSGVGKLILRGFHYILPHFEFFDLRQFLVHEQWGAPAIGVVLITILYALFYGTFFTALATWLFRRRQL